MRYVFFFAALFIAGLVSAQTNDNKVKKSPNNFQGRSTVTVPGSQPQVSLLSEKNFSHVLPNGNRVYTLSLDNMPCIAPDLKQFNMPNAGSPDLIPKTKNAMPDPSRPAVMRIANPPATKPNNNTTP